MYPNDHNSLSCSCVPQAILMYKRCHRFWQFARISQPFYITFPPGRKVKLFCTNLFQISLMICLISEGVMCIHHATWLITININMIFFYQHLFNFVFKSSYENEITPNSQNKVPYPNECIFINDILTNFSFFIPF